MIWTPDAGTVVATRDDVQIAVVTQTEHRLYVLVEVPGATIAPPTPDRNGWNVRVFTADGEAQLRTGGGGGYASRDLTFVTAAFEPVAVDDELHLAVELDGAEVYRARLRPQP